MCNTVFGAMGSSYNPLFLRNLGASITAFGRLTITTVRDIMVSRGYTYLFADTDSCFCVLPETITTYQQVSDEMKVINSTLQKKIDTPFMSLEIEEIVKSIVLCGRKSYYTLNYEKE